MGFPFKVSRRLTSLRRNLEMTTSWQQSSRCLRPGSSGGSSAFLESWCFASGDRRSSNYVFREGKGWNIGAVCNAHAVSMINNQATQLPYHTQTRAWDPSLSRYLTRTFVLTLICRKVKYHCFISAGQITGTRIHYDTGDSLEQVQ